MYQQHEEESEILNDCVHRLENNLAQLKRHVRIPTRKALKFDTTSESDSSTTDDQKSPSKTSQILTSSNVTQSNTYTSRYNTSYAPVKLGPDIVEMLGGQTVILCLLTHDNGQGIQKLIIDLLFTFILSLRWG